MNDSLTTWPITGDIITVVNGEVAMMAPTTTGLPPFFLACIGELASINASYIALESLFTSFGKRVLSKE